MNDPKHPADQHCPTGHPDHSDHSDHPDHHDRAHHGDPDDIGCLRAIEAFYAYLDGELDEPESIAEFEHHMAHCRSCFSRTQVERMLTDRMKETARSKAPEALKSRLRNLMNKF
jgi:anti-sigma factor (TIGR02949 family)